MASGGPKPPSEATIPVPVRFPDEKLEKSGHPNAKPIPSGSPPEGHGSGETFCRIQPKGSAEGRLKGPSFYIKAGLRAGEYLCIPRAWAN